MRRTLSFLFLGLLSACGRTAPAELPHPDAGRTAAQVDSLYAQGEALFRDGKWTRALDAFTLAAPMLGSDDPRYLRYRFYMGEIHYARSEYLQATREFRRLADEVPEDSLAPVALYRAGMAYRELWRKPQLDPSYGQTAMQVFAEVASRYPGTVSAARAQIQVLELQEWAAEKEYRNARFYLRYSAHNSAVLVLRDLVANYPRTRWAPLALLRMVEAYEKLGYEEDREETCEYIRTYHPGIKDLAKICPPASAGGT